MRLRIPLAAATLLTGLVAFGYFAWPQDRPAPAGVDALGDPLPAGVRARMGGVRMDLGSAVGAAIFSRDGKSVSVARGRYERDQGLRFIDLTTGKTDGRNLPLPYGVREHAFSPDERILAVRTFEQKNGAGPGVINVGRIHVLDAATGKTIWATDPEVVIESMALSPDGKLIAGGKAASVGEPSDVFVWDTATGKQRAVLAAHRTPIARLAFSADGKRLVSASEDGNPIEGSKLVKGNVCVWDVSDGKLLRKVSPSGFGYAVSPNGQSIAFQGDARAGKKVTLWDVDRDKKIAVLAVAGAVCRFSPDGKALATGSETEMLRLWNAADGREIRLFQGPVGNGVLPLAFSADGKLLATSCGVWSSDTSIRLWDVTTGSERTRAVGHRLDITCLAFAADGKTLVSGSLDQTVRIWETATGKEIRKYDDHKAAISAVTISSDGRTIASCDQAGVTHVWDAITGNILLQFRGQSAGPKARASVSVLAFSPDGKSIWIGTSIYKLNDGVPIDGKGDLSRYDLATGRWLGGPKNEKRIPIAISPDGSLSVWTERIKPASRDDVSLGRWEEKVVVVEIGTGRELRDLSSKDTLVHKATFSPDGRLIALRTHVIYRGLYKSLVAPSFRLVESASGKDIVNETEKDYPFIAFVPGGQVLAGSHQIRRLIAPVSSMPRVERPNLDVVDVRTGKTAAELPSYPTAAGPAAVSADAGLVAAVVDNRTILIWDLPKARK
ncbi:MAG TPA: WD40 repeat domain-containing protein [Gemmataceae bacterium]|jgi:WD40 repeat protein|nr:WD40 repeat domain-containing protein [Gemmataceae bacterium]